MKLHDNAQLQTSKMRQRMHLSDGRTLAFDEYGAADGFPVVYMHGTPGSKLDWLFLAVLQKVWGTFKSVKYSSSSDKAATPKRRTMNEF